MKKTTVFSTITIMLLLAMMLVSCSGGKVKAFGKSFASEKEVIEKSLSVKLGGISDSDIKVQKLKEIKNVHKVTIKSIDLSSRKDSFAKEGLSSDWQEYPFSLTLASMLVNIGIPNEFDLNAIKNGMYTTVRVEKDGGNFDRKDALSSGQYLTIGIWDADTGILYSIDIEN